MNTTGTGLAARIQADVERLCAFEPDRHVGSEGNREATEWLADRFAADGFEVERIGFDCVDWRAEGATLSAHGKEHTLSPGPYSPGARLNAAPLRAVGSYEELQRLPGEEPVVLFFHGELAKDQLTPRNYPFYSFDQHTAVIAELDRLQPGAVIAATGSNPGVVGALSPFPIAEDADFGFPSAYLHESRRDELLALDGEQVDLVIESEQTPSRGEQVVARRGPGAKRIVLSAHVDSRFGTPGALDNAASVGTLLAVSSILPNDGSLSVEIVPFNGEDNFAAYGEMAYLRSAGDLSDVILAINLDAAGYCGAITHVSHYGVDDALKSEISAVQADFRSITDGPAWPQSDHMVFAMQGVPAIAITTSELMHVAAEYTHTERDVPDLVDSTLLADVAHFLVALIDRLRST